jgi:hypothetical protein
MQITKIDVTNIRQYGKYLFNQYRDSCQSFEQAAQVLCRDIYSEFQTEEAEPEFALVRVFRSIKYEDLSADLQQKASTREPQLALMGTMGIEASWQSRHKSQKRQLIPINEKMSPMFQGVFAELGFPIADFHGDSAKGQSVHSMKMLRYYHVPDASQSQAITDQESFVSPYRIKSVIAVGTQFLSHQAFVLIAFSRVPISSQKAEIFSELAPHVSTLLAIFDGRKAYWTS